MATKYSVAEARAKLPTILDDVELGQDVELTRRGKPVAMLVSLEEYRRLTGGQRSFSEAYEQHRSRYDGLARVDLTGLRDETAGRGSAF